MKILKLFKRDEIKTRIVPPTLERCITGKVTRPAVHVTDPAFDTGKYRHTNLAETFARARQQQRQR